MSDMTEQLSLVYTIEPNIYLWMYQFQLTILSFVLGFVFIYGVDVCFYIYPGISQVNKQNKYTGTQIPVEDILWTLVI